MPGLSCKFVGCANEKQGGWGVIGRGRKKNPLFGPVLAEAATRWRNTAYHSTWGGEDARIGRGLVFDDEIAAQADAHPTQFREQGPRQPAISGSTKTI